MKVIFLDVDGVLNSVEDCRKSHWTMRAPSGVFGISKTRIKLLKKIVNATDAKIVLVSSWKSSYDFYIKNYKKTYYRKITDRENDMLESINATAWRDGRYLREKLRRYGVEIMESTSEYETSIWERGAAIQAWIAAHQVDSWVVLDDEIFPDYIECGIIDHLVQPHWAGHGLDDYLATRAIKMLNK